MISIDAPFRISEEFRALGVCLLMHTGRATCTSTGTSLILLATAGFFRVRGTGKCVALL